MNWQPKKIVASLVSIYVAIAFVHFHATGGRAFSDDPATYLFGGALLAKGRSPYLHLWDIKPPAIHETAAILTVLLNGNRALIHTVSVLLTGFMLVLAATLTAAIAYELSGNRVASVLGGLTVMSFPPALGLFLNGPYVKYYAVAFGILSLFMFTKEYYYIGAAIAGLSAAYWQPAIGFPIVYLLMIVQVVYSREASPRLVGGVLASLAGITIIIISPFLILGSLDAMIAQTVLAPTTGGATSYPLGWVTVITRFELAGVIVPIGVVGLLFLLYDGLTTNDPLSLGIGLLGIWFGFVISYIGQHGRPDVIPFAVLLGFGITRILVMISTLSDRYFSGKLAMYMPLGSIVSIMVILPLGLASVYLYGDDVFGIGSLAELYLSGGTPESCHARLSGAEEAWIELTGGDKTAEKCLNDLEEVLRRIQ